MTQNEKYLIALIKVNNFEACTLYLQDYIQRNGPVSNEAGDEIKKIFSRKIKAESEEK